MRGGGAAMALAVLAAAVAPGTARAQAPDCGTRTEAPWTLGWTPLVSLGDPGRGGPATPASMASLSAAAPRVGLLWSAGSPAAIATDVDSGSLRLALGNGAESGSFRRPLDPGDLGATGACGLGWQPVGNRGAAIGHVLVSRASEGGGGTSAVLVDPYSIDPLVQADSAAPDLVRATVVAEGAIGWRWGGWSVGTAVGFAAEQVNTHHARVGHLDHVAMPGLTIGIARRLPWQGITIGILGRRTSRSENGNVVPIADKVVITALQGMAEVEPAVLGASPYFRRLDRDGRALGAAASGQSLGVRWAAWWEHERDVEAQTSTQQNNPPSDRWQGVGPRAGVAAQRALAGQALLVTVQGTMQNVNSDARRSDLTGIIVRQTARDWNTTAGAVWQPAGARWAAFAQGEVGRSRRFTRDAVAELTDERAAWEWGGGGGAMVRVSPRVQVSAGAAAALYTPAATIPAEDSLGVVYRTYIAPEVEYYAAQALGMAAQGRVSWQRTRYRMYLAVGVSSLAPRAGSTVDAFTPAGSRRTITVSLGAER